MLPSVHIALRRHLDMVIHAHPHLGGLWLTLMVVHRLMGLGFVSRYSHCVTAQLLLILVEMML